MQPKQQLQSPGTRRRIANRQFLTAKKTAISPTRLKDADSNFATSSPVSATNKTQSSPNRFIGKFGDETPARSNYKNAATTKNSFSPRNVRVASNLVLNPSNKKYFPIMRQERSRSTTPPIKSSCRKTIKDTDLLTRAFSLGYNPATSNHSTSLYNSIQSPKNTCYDDGREWGDSSSTQFLRKKKMKRKLGELTPGSHKCDLCGASFRFKGQLYKIHMKMCRRQSDLRQMSSSSCSKNSSNSPTFSTFNDKDGSDSDEDDIIIDLTMKYENTAPTTVKKKKSVTFIETNTNDEPSILQEIVNRMIDSIETENL